MAAFRFWGIGTDWQIDTPALLGDGLRDAILAEVARFDRTWSRFSIGTLSACRVVEIPRPVILELTERPAIARAFWWASLVDEATLREWLVNIGQREAEVRIAHLLCELLMRLRAVGLVTASRYTLPLTQTDLAEPRPTLPRHRAYRSVVRGSEQLA